ncbi:MAG: metalloprotease TldD [Gammaproteobacteria bacterium]
MHGILGPSIDAADLYFQSMQSEAWVMEDGIIKEGNFNVDKGVGLRAISGEKTGFAYSDDLILPALEEAAMAARSIARAGTGGAMQVWQKQGAEKLPKLYQSITPLDSISTADKLDLLKLLDARARAMDPRIKQVIVGLSGSFEEILILASDGTLMADKRPLVRLNITVIAEDTAGRREQGFAGGGGRHGYQDFLLNNLSLAFGFVEEAVRQALVNLEAIPAPAGTMPVVLGSGWPGVLLHEAVGHGLEGDFNRKGTSAYAGRMGQVVASTLCTVVDDGTLPNRRGSLNVDDEGVPTQCTTLIKDGVLVNYLQDKLNAKLMNTKPTGNGRRESYAHQPMPRMTNTYMLPGKHDPEEIIASVEKGLYAVNFAGGQVDITSGKFVFSASEAYLIENGKITQPVKGATLVGNGPDVLTRVSMVGHDLKLDTGVGVCGKNGQSVPVGVGQPTLKVDAMTVGGTN